MDMVCIQPTENERDFEHKLNHGTIDEETFSACVECSALSPKVRDKIYLLDHLQDDEYYQSRFTHLYDILTRMKKNKIEFPTSKALIQNLFWMFCNGLNSYDEVVQAVELYQKAHADTSITYSDDEATFKNACSGVSRKNMEFRYIILSRIVDEVREDDAIEEFLEQDVVEEILATA